jgi:diguanylate cyclase (GGDEF)-like protein
MADLGLTGEALNQAFPFYIGVSADGLILATGPSLDRVAPEIKAGRHLFDSVRFIRPRNVNPRESLSLLLGELLIVTTLTDMRVPLRGQLVQDHENFIFLLSPQINELATLTSLGLTLKDFAIHDGVVDHLLLIQAQHRSLTEAQQLSNRLRVSLGREEALDRLTGLANRDEFNRRLSRSVDRTRGRQRVGVILIDLDNFKSVNSSLGVAGGDAVLVYFARALAQLLPSTFTVSRIGADEFGVIVEPDDGVLRVIATEIQGLFAQSIRIGETEVAVGASIGFTAGREDDRGEDTLRRAQRALFKAKSEGRGRVVEYTDNLAVEFHEPGARATLQKALGSKEIEAWYQPIIDLRTQQIVGVETLARWATPDGVLLPDQFILLAEETGQVVELGYQMLASATHAVSRWNGLRRKPLFVSVNVASRQLMEDDFPEQAERLCLAAGVPTSTVVLELTESSVLSVSSRLQDQLIDLSHRGFRLALDDFGTGWGTLAHIRNLPIDTVKLDRAFVSGVGTRSADDAIVAAVVAMAKALSLTSVAEGIENVEQAEALARMGCDSGQGWLYAKAMTVDQMTDLIVGAASEK